MKGHAGLRLLGLALLVFWAGVAWVVWRLW